MSRNRAISLAAAGVLIPSAWMVGRRLWSRRHAPEASELAQVPSPPTPLERKFGEGSRDVVEQASAESFPASDPPAW